MVVSVMTSATPDAVMDGALDELKAELVGLAKELGTYVETWSPKTVEALCQEILEVPTRVLRKWKATPGWLDAIHRLQSGFSSWERTDVSTPPGVAAMTAHCRLFRTDGHAMFWMYIVMADAEAVWPPEFVEALKGTLRKLGISSTAKVDNTQDPSLHGGLALHVTFGVDVKALSATAVSS